MTKKEPTLRHKAAIAYAKLGYAIIPLHSIINQSCTCSKGNKCGSPGKHPRTINGIKEASRDLNQINKWWTMWPNANIGLATGAINNIIVLDFDGQPGEIASETLEDSLGKLPDTVLQLTGGGGKHLIFKHPNFKIENKVKIIDGFDVRGDGGYIVVAPSNHISDRDYQWEQSSKLGIMPIAQIPKNWLDYIAIQPKEVSNRQITDAIIPVGARNDTLYRAACSMREKGYSDTVIDVAIHEMNISQCYSPLDESEINTIIKSACTYELGKLNIIQSEFENEDDKYLNRAINLAKVTEYNPTNAEIIKSGIPSLDRELGGYEMGLITVWTGINGAGKSTVLAQTLLESVEQGYNVFAFSGELQAHKFKYWIDLQAAGGSHLTKKISQRTNKSYYEINQTAKKPIRDWYDEKLWLYDNKSGMSFEEILKTMKVNYRKRNCRIFLIDNLMRLDLKGLNRDQYEAQSQFINEISNFAQVNNVHIHVVAHPRKIMGTIITKMDVSGAGDLTNRADNVIAVHRITGGFKKEFEKENKKMNPSDKEYILTASNAVEIFKSRDYGVVNALIPLIYHEDSKRLVDKANPILKNKKYGWEVK